MTQNTPRITKLEAIRKVAHLRTIMRICDKRWPNPEAISSPIYDHGHVERWDHYPCPTKSKFYAYFRPECGNFDLVVVDYWVFADPIFQKFITTQQGRAIADGYFFGYSHAYYLQYYDVKRYCKEHQQIFLEIVG